MKCDSVWFTWEDHRRSRELAGAFESKYIFLDSSLPRLFRYLILSFKTIIELKNERPHLVFCQNPSIILAFVLCIYKRWFGYTLVVDRHSNFKFEHQSSSNPIWLLFWWVSKFTVRNANLTIVTNEDLKVIVDSWGGEGFVLPDKIPSMEVDQVEGENLNDSVQVLAITTFDSDEPITEIIEAAEILGDSFTISFTGRYSKYFERSREPVAVPKNVRLLGFVPEDEYRKLLGSADVAVVLTSKDLILNCGAYEAVAMNTPAVVSNTKTMKSFFYKGFVHVNLDPSSIAKGIVYCLDHKIFLKKELLSLKFELERAWNLRQLEANRKFTEITKIS